MLRRLRSKARHAKAAETDFESFRNNEIRLKLRRAMDEWKAKIPEVADSTVHSEYYGQEWMSHLYDYALIDLLHAPRHSLTVEDLQELLSAACRGLKTFVACREEKHITCYTLTAVSSYHSRKAVTTATKKAISDSCDYAARLSVPRRYNPDLLPLGSACKCPLEFRTRRRLCRAEGVL